MAKREREMNKEEEEEEPWGTLEELLLACAVNRHGSKSWDSIATELQSRTSHHHLRPFFTPPNCRRRFAHLRRRFSQPDSDDTSLKDMVDELRRLRVAELRRDVERHDVSIEFLQSKVKRLEQEHQQSFNPKDEVKEETDLPERREPETNHPPEVVGRSVSGDDNRSFNESNSTSTQKREEGDKPELKYEPGFLEDKPERAVIEPVGAGWKVAEMSDSVAESKREEGPKHNNNKNNNNNNNNNTTSSEVQSPRNKKRRCNGEEEEEPDAGKPVAVKSQPLIKLLAILRSHKNGLLFERRLRSQETEKYKKMIRQHVDLQTVQTRLDKGFYLHSHHRFFRDLLLLFNNATVFFPNNSPEHIAARQLTKLVTKQIPRNQPPEPKTVPPSPPPPLVVCRRRSAPNKTRDVDEAKLKQQPNRSLGTGVNKVLLEDKCIKKKKKKKKKKKQEVVKEMHELSRRSSRSNSNKVIRDINNHSEDDDDDKLESRVKRKESMMKKKKKAEVGEDTDTIDYVEKEEEEKKKGRRDSRREKWRKDETRENEERGENSRGRRPGRPPKRQPESRRDVGRGKRGRESGGSEVAIAEDSGRSKKRLRR